MKEKLKLFIGLFLAISIPLLFGDYIPVYYKSIFLAISNTIKQCLMYILPLIIFSFIFSSIISFGVNALKLVILLFVIVFCSNILAIFFGYSIGNIAIDFIKLNNVSNLALQQDQLNPLWKILFTPIISNKTALFSGFVAGVISSIFKFKLVNQLAYRMNYVANFVLKKLFIPIIPFFVLGFVLKLEHEQMLVRALSAFGPFFFVIILSQATYIFFVYYLVSNCKIKKAFSAVKNILPASITGLTTISSAASLPILIMYSKKNVESKMADTIIPATINIHTLGSAIGLTILIFATANVFNVKIDSGTFVVFAYFYALAKFAVAAVPGGVVIVAYPLLEQYLGFSSEMLGVITTMYLLFDPIGTAMNVTGNGAFVIGFSKIYRKIIKPDG